MATIIVMDDDDGVMEYMADMLKLIFGSDVKVVLAFNPDQGREAFASEGGADNIACIIADVSQPRFVDWSFADWLLTEAKYPAGRIVAVSALPHPTEAKQRGLRLLPKPIKGFEPAVRAAMEGKSKPAD